MIDFNKLMTDELNERRKGNMFQAYQPQEQPPQAEDQPQIPEHAIKLDHIHIDEETDLNGTYGPQQVQSLLGLALDFSLRKKLSDATDDVDAVRHLNRLKNRGG